MTIQALAWAIDQQLPPKPKLVLLSLANHADHMTGKVDFLPSTIAWESATPQGSIWRFLGALERNGFLEHDQRGESAEERDYYLLIDRNPALPWSWGASGEEGDEQESASHHQTSRPIETPPGFDRSKQNEKRVAAAKAKEEQKPTQVFVIEGTPAFEAWCAFKSREKGHAWRLADARHMVDGNFRRGWWFPTLFPPVAQAQEMEAIDL